MNSMYEDIDRLTIDASGLHLHISKVQISFISTYHHMNKSKRNKHKKGLGYFKIVGYLIL